MVKEHETKINYRTLFTLRFFCSPTGSSFQVTYNHFVYFNYFFANNWLTYLLLTLVVLLGIYLLVPLFNSSYDRAFDLATAMEARDYQGEKDAPNIDN